MTYTYPTPRPGAQAFLLRSDGAYVPVDRSNADYQAYLAWLAAGNTAPPGAPTS